jgi:hypothetical protein
MESMINHEKAVQWCKFVIHFEYKIWQAPLYGSSVNLAYSKNFGSIHKIRTH